MNSETAKQRLDASLAGLRQVFGHYRGSSNWTDPMSVADSSDTETRSVWDLTDEQYKDYGWHSVCLSGPPKEELLAIRYFLPRVAADLTFKGDPVWCVPHLASLLNAYAWHGWPDIEVNAIVAWMASWVEFTASERQWYMCFEATKCAAISGCDMNKIFHDLRERDWQTSILWLTQQIEMNWNALLNTGWPEGWQDWGNTAPESAATEFVSLLLRRSSIGLLQNAFFNGDVEDQTLLSQAVAHAEYCIQYAHFKADTPLDRAVRHHNLADQSRG